MKTEAVYGLVRVRHCTSYALHTVSTTRLYRPNAGAGNWALRDPPCLLQDRLPLRDLMPIFVGCWVSLAFRTRLLVVTGRLCHVVLFGGSVVGTPRLAPPRPGTRPTRLVQATPSRLIAGGSSILLVRHLPATCPCCCDAAASC